MDNVIIIMTMSVYDAALLLIRLKKSAWQHISIIIRHTFRSRDVRRPPG
jgi:hypothetical protein